MKASVKIFFFENATKVVKINNPNPQFKGFGFGLPSLKISILDSVNNKHVFMIYFLFE